MNWLIENKFKILTFFLGVFVLSGLTAGNPFYHLENSAQISKAWAAAPTPACTFTTSGGVTKSEFCGPCQFCNNYVGCIDGLGPCDPWQSCRTGGPPPSPTTSIFGSTSGPLRCDPQPCTGQNDSECPGLAAGEAFCEEDQGLCGTCDGANNPPAGQDHFDVNGCTGVVDEPCVTGTCNFTPVCDDHDACYGTHASDCGNDKSACDASFEPDLKSVCSGISHSGTQAECNSWASIYGNGIGPAADIVKAYSKAQQNVCCL